MLFFKPCTKNYNHNFCSILSRKLKAITVLNNRKWHRITSSHLTSLEKKKYSFQEYAAWEAPKSTCKFKRYHRKSLGTFRLMFCQ